MVFGQAFVYRVKTEPLSGFLNTENPTKVANPLVDMRLDMIKEDFAEAKEEGWTFKASTFEEIGEDFGLENLATTMECYSTLDEAVTTPISSRRPVTCSP